MSGSTNVGLAGNAYSFYLNVVVLEHIPPAAAAATPTVEEEGEEITKDSREVNLAPAAVTEVSNVDSEEQRKATTPSSITRNGEEQQKRGILGLSIMSDNLDKSLHNIGKAVSKQSSNFRTKGATFVASKTMVSRALTALSKSLPDLAYESEDLELTIGKRFHQGRVIVLHVDLKPTAMPRYVEEILGMDSAEHYRSAMHTLRLLGASDSIQCLEQEMLPQVRQGLMEKLKDMLLTTLKEKDDLLEVDCIALEEAEEARWLFTFMQFQEQMK